MLALVARLHALLAGRAIPLRRVAPFPGGFLFWHVDAGAPARALLQSAHEDALTLADSALDADANEAVVAGPARATDNDTQLVANARHYGYAFVKDQYRPHITLGFAPEVVASISRRDHVHTMRVERVVVARLGRLGRVEEIVAP